MVLSEEERKQRQCASKRKYKKLHPEYVKKWRDDHRSKNPEKYSEYCRRWRTANRDKIRAKAREKYISKPPKRIVVICDILVEHVESLKDDPDRLSTDFIIDLMEKTK